METDPRWRYCYVVEVPLSGTEQWYHLTIAVTPEAAAEVVRVLLACGGPDPWMVRVSKRPAD